MKRITLKDLSEMTGYSIATVSRSLHDHPRISREVKTNIMEIAKQVGYQPSMIARGFRENKSYLIGLIISDLDNHFHAAVTHRIIEDAQLEGYQVIMRSTQDRPDGVKEAIEDMKKSGVDGIIITATRLHEDSVKSLIEEKFPIVQVMRRLKEDLGVQIVADGTYGTQVLVSHLLRLGRTRIAMIGGPENLSTSQNRYEGYFQTMRENNIPIDDKLVMKGDAFSYNAGYRLCKKMLRDGIKPDAIVCADDQIAFGAMQVLDEAGISIPDGIALVGFDDCEMSSHPRIQLTSVRYDIDQMSLFAVRSILQQIEGNFVEHKLIKLVPQLVVRSTCGYQAI